MHQAAVLLAAATLGAVLAWHAETPARPARPRRRRLVNRFGLHPDRGRDRAHCPEPHGPREHGGRRYRPSRGWSPLPRCGSDRCTGTDVATGIPPGTSVTVVYVDNNTDYCVQPAAAIVVVDRETTADVEVVCGPVTPARHSPALFGSSGTADRRVRACDGYISMPRAMDSSKRARSSIWTRPISFHGFRSDGRVCIRTGRPWKLTCGAIRGSTSSGVAPLTKQARVRVRYVFGFESPARNASSAALVSSGRSCWTQCPADGISVTPRKSVLTRLIDAVSCSAEAPRITPSRSPAMNAAGTVIFRSASCGVVSQFRWKLR